jgi:tetratricopeptide (TPR) repeat protein
MARNHLGSLARNVLAVGLFCWSCGCAGIDHGPPQTRTTRDEGGRDKAISPAQQADVQISLARVAEHEGNFDAAAAGYQAALGRDKSRGDVHLHLANIQTLKGDYRRAEEEYQKALEFSPGSAEIFCDMGYSLYLQHKWDGAERNLKQAIAIDPNHVRAHNNLALVLAHTERVQESLSEFRRAGISAAEAHVNLAFALSLDKRWDLARDQYRRALAANPTSEATKSRLRDIDRLIVANYRPVERPGRTQDAATIPTSAARSARAERPAGPENVDPSVAANPRPNGRVSTQGSRMSTDSAEELPQLQLSAPADIERMLAAGDRTFSKRQRTRGARTNPESAARSNQARRSSKRDSVTSDRQGPLSDATGDNRIAPVLAVDLPEAPLAAPHNSDRSIAGVIHRPPQRRDATSDPDTFPAAAHIISPPKPPAEVAPKIPMPKRRVPPPRPWELHDPAAGKPSMQAPTAADPGEDAAAPSASNPSS